MTVCSSCNLGNMCPDSKKRHGKNRLSSAKFQQNPSLREHLVATGSKRLVEASPYDTFWGIGLRNRDPDAREHKLWRGINHLGQLLMVVSSDLN